MKTAIGIGVIVAAALMNALSPHVFLGQACNDEKTMVDDYKQGLATAVDTVKKESLEDFEKNFHQKACLSKLTLCLNVMDEILNCLDKASQDPAATKDAAAAYKAERESYEKLKGKLTQYKTQLKAAEAPKDAKALIGKFDLVN